MAYPSNPTATVASALSSPQVFEYPSLDDPGLCLSRIRRRDVPRHAASEVPTCAVYPSPPTWTDRSIEFAAASWVAGKARHSSNTIEMSDPSRAWMSVTHSE